MTLALPGVAYAYANHGRWVADCPGLYCHNALQLDRGQLYFACLGMDACGTQADVCWPPDIEAIEVILSLRPDRTTRNWLPGESLQQLALENAQHGIDVPAGADGLVLETRDETAVAGKLFDLRSLVSTRRAEIGA